MDKFIGWLDSFFSIIINLFSGEGSFKTWLNQILSTISYYVANYPTVVLGLLGLFIIGKFDIFKSKVNISKKA